MPVLTSLEAESRSGGVRVRVDGEPFGTVAAADVAALNLRPGEALDAARRADIGHRAEVFSARAVALRMLAARALPARELTRRLERRGHARAVAEAAVEQLTDAGIVNDREFAEQFASARARRQRFGQARLVRELTRFGIPSRAAESAVRESLARDGVDTGALLREAAARKLRALAGADPAQQRRRLRQYLIRRGFAASEVVAYLREIAGNRQ